MKRVEQCIKERSGEIFGSNLLWFIF